MIPFTKFEPDRATFANDASPSVTNALPVADGWGPMPTLGVITAALGAQCIGGCRVRTPAGVIRVFAGTATNIYEMDGVDFTWDDVTGTGPYAVPDGDRWCWTIYGDRLIATALGQVSQYIDVTSGTAFADLPGSPPQARYGWNAGEYFCLGNHDNAPNRIMTSGIGDAGWWTVGERGCDFQDFPDGGEVMGGVSADNGAVVIQREKIRYMNVAQVGDYSFTTSTLNADRGTIAPFSIAQTGPGQFFYYSADGFFLGAQGKPIGAERVDRWFRAFADQNTVESLRSVTDPVRKIVWTQAQYQSGIKFLLGYNWQLDRWCYSDLNVSEMLVMAIPSLGWDALDVPIDEDGEAFDAVANNRDGFAAFDTENQLGFLNGPSASAVLETSDVALVPGQRAWLQELQTFTDCEAYSLQAGTMERIGQEPEWGNAVRPYDPTGICHFRSEARMHRVRFISDAGEVWKVATGVEPLFVPAGSR